MEPPDLPQNFLQQDENEDTVEYEIPEHQDEEIAYAEWVESGHEEDQKYMMEEEEVVKDFGQYDTSAEPVFLEGNDDQLYDERQFEEYDDQHGEEMSYNAQSVSYNFERHSSDTDVPIVEKSKRKSTIVECEYCGQILRYPSKIQAHMRTHTGEKPFSCSICGARFSQKVPMMNHVKKHMGDTPYQCSFCPKKFVLPSQKNAHELRHQGIKRLGPPKPHLKPPIRRVTPIKTEFDDEEMDMKPVTLSWMPAFDVTEQPLSAAAAKRIEEVIESVANGGKKKPPKISTRPVMMAQCNICGLMIKHASKIQEHMRTHTGEKPFGCTVCGLRFSRLYSLKIHMKRKHTADRKITCTWDCGMHFVTISARNEHERVVHAGIKRYLCNVPGCRRMFTRRVYLMSHRIKGHPDQHQPLFDPHEISAAEEIEQMNSQHFQNEEVILTDDQLEKLIELPDGMIVLPEGAQILEGEFIDEEEEVSQSVSAQMYLEEHVERIVNARNSEINDAKPLIDNSKYDRRTSGSIIEESSLPEEEQAEDEVSETVKHIWVEGDGAQKKRMTIRILKRH